MLTQLFLTLGIVGAGFVFLAVGAIVGKTRLRGTCKGGKDEAGCDVCQNDTDQCVKKESPFLRPLKGFLGQR